MTGEELIAAFRNDTGDRNTPYGWSNQEVLRWLNEGQNEACRRARLLVDSTTAAICEVAVTANNPTVMLDPRVIFVRRATLNGQACPLARVRLRDMDARMPGWHLDTAPTTPTIYIPDYQAGALRLHNIPNENTTLYLTVVRLPLLPITLAGTPQVDPETPFYTHEALIHWVKHRAYLKEDEDTKDEALSKKSLALFEAEFGPKSSAFDERWIGDNYDPDDGGLY